jgi:malate dehydrogenase (oxaloacetate-decarboxylating)
MSRMRPLPDPFEDVAAGRPAVIRQAGPALLGNRLLTKDLAFSVEEREAFDLLGLLPNRVLTIGEQLELELEHLRVKGDPLERYIGLAALQDRNATLYYRLLAEHLAEFLPIVYTPTVGRACQEYSHIIRRTRGTWITPEDVDRIPRVLRQGPFADVRLIVVTDNERILGLGDQGAGGMAIPIGKLALYTAACGIHPSLTLPVSLDVGTDNPALLADPLYLGYRHARLRGPAYDELVEAFVAGVAEVWPGCLIQFEDFKQHNALRLLDRYQYRVPSFNDDIQGTAAVVLGGVLAGLRAAGRTLEQARVVIVGAGAAGIGVARLLRMAMRADGVDDTAIRLRIALIDTRGLVHTGRTDLEGGKLDLAVSALDAGSAGDLRSVVRDRRPNVLVGATGVAGTFDEPLIRAMMDGLPADERPIVLPLSNPTSVSEADPADVIAWTGGRALVATGSPFAPVEHIGRRHQIGQANNVFIFPGVGLGAIVTEARAVTDRMFLLAARELAAAVSDDRLADGAIYPLVADLRRVSRRIAVVVAQEAVASGLAAAADRAQEVFDARSAVEAAMWWPDYVPYFRGG